MSVRPHPRRRDSREYEEGHGSHELNALQDNFNTIQGNIERELTTSIYGVCYRARLACMSLKQGISSLSKALPALLRERDRTKSREGDAAALFDNVTKRIGELRRQKSEDEDEISRLIDDTYRVLTRKRYISLATIAKMLEYWSHAYEAVMSVRNIFLKNDSETKIFNLQARARVRVENFGKAIRNRETQTAQQERDELMKIYARIIELIQRLPDINSRENTRIIKNANTVIGRSMEDTSRLKASVEEKRKKVSMRPVRRGNSVEGGDYHGEPRRNRGIQPRQFIVGGVKGAAPPPRRRQGPTKSAL